MKERRKPKHSKSMVVPYAAAGTVRNAMRAFAQNEPLTETELGRLDEFLKSYKGGKAMKIEEVDGFFSALIAGPEIVAPSEYMPELFGRETPETRAFSTLQKLTKSWGS